MPFAVVLILLVVGSILFHVLSPWWFTELASNWAMVDVTMDITFYVTGLVFVAVNLFMAYCVIKFRYKKGSASDLRAGEQEARELADGLTAIGVAAMLTPGLLSGPISSMFRKKRMSLRPSASNGTGRTVTRAKTASLVRSMPSASRTTTPSVSIRMIRTVRTMCWSTTLKRISRSTSRSSSCCAPKTYCTTSRSPSSASRWTWFRA